MSFAFYTELVLFIIITFTFIFIFTEGTLITIVFVMEFTVIDANVIRSSCTTTECSKTDIKDDLEDLIIEFKEIGCLDLSCLSKNSVYRTPMNIR